MNPLKSNMSVLAQIVKLISAKSVDFFANKYKIQTRVFSPTSHVVAMLYSHLSHALSLNDICDSLQNHSGTLSQIRNCTPPSRNGLSHANRTRNADMVEDLFWKIYNDLKAQYPKFFNSSRQYPGLPHRFKTAIYAFDSSTIQLTTNSLEWAKHRRRKAAVKMHTGLNMQSFLPDFVIMKSAHHSDPKMAWELCANLKEGEICVFDKAYVDFKHLAHLNKKEVHFVTRSKDNMVYEIMGQHTIVAVAQTKNDEQKDMGQHVSQDKGKRQYIRKKIRIISDEKIQLSGNSTKEHYNDPLRLVTAEVEVKGKMVQMTFITNNFKWSPYTVCKLYQARWGIEVFFKEIKQTLQLSDFLGYNENAVRWQIWTALIAYLLLRFIEWENKWKHTFSRLFTLVRGVLWNYFDLTSIIDSCDTMGLRGKRIIRGSPETAYQLYLDL